MKIPTPKKLPSGSWTAVVMVDGKRISVTRPTKRECQTALLEIKLGMTSTEEPSALTLSDAIDRYIEDKETVLSPATIRGYKRIQKKRFQYLMSTDIYKIEKEDLQRAVTLEAKTISPKSVYNAYGLVSAVMRYFNIVIDGIKLPQVVRKQKKYLQPEDIGKLIEAVKGDLCETQILMAVWLGMRRSEICGLCWDSVDLDSGKIYVHRAMVPDEHNKYIIKEAPKNSSSQRVLDCPEYILDKLRAMPNKTGQVFRQHPEILSRHVHKACEAAGITDTTMHGLRHTNAAVMKSLGFDDAHAMQRGGWSSESTYKRVYSYVFDSAKNASDNAIDNFFLEKITNEITNKI